MVEVTFQGENGSEQVIWRSFEMQDLDVMQIEAKARQSLRLGKQRWKIKQINKWSVRGW